MPRRIVLGLALSVAACATPYGTAEPDLAPAAVTAQTEPSAPVTKSQPTKTQTTPPAPSKVEPLTCESIATLEPAAKLTTTENTVGYADSPPVDMFAKEYTNAGTKNVPARRYLHLMLTSIPQECAIAVSTVSPSSETWVDVALWKEAPDETSPMPTIGPGTYTENGAHAPPLQIHVTRWKQQLCTSDGEPVGTASDDSWEVTGTVTISSRTETEIVGKIDLHDANGHSLRMAFQAPICNTDDRANRTCCAPEGK